MHTAALAIGLYAPGAVCISNTDNGSGAYLTKNILKIINGPGPYDPGANGPGP